jgi:MFS family permease
MNAAASFLALFIVALGYGVIVPLGPTLVREAMGQVAAPAISFHTGALSAAYLLAFAAFAPLWGRVADVAARRVIAAAGLAGFALSFALLAKASAMTAVYVALIAAGGSAAAVVPAIQVQIGRVSGDLAKARLLTALGAASFAGWFLGPPLASWSIGIGQARGLSAAGLPLGVIATLGFAAAIFSYHAIPAGSPFIAGDAAQTARQPFTRGAWQFGLLSMAVAFGLGGFEVSLVLWILQVMRLDAGQVSLLLVECTVVMMVVQATMFFVPAARPRWKPAGAAAAFAGMAAAIALTPLAPGVIAMSALVAVLAAAATVLQAMLSFGTVTTAGNRPGAALGLQLSLSSVGQGLGSFSAGALFSASGDGFYPSATLLAVAAIGAGSMSKGPSAQRNRDVSLL